MLDFFHKGRVYERRSVNSHDAIGRQLFTDHRNGFTEKIGSRAMLQERAIAFGFDGEVLPRVNNQDSSLRFDGYLGPRRSSSTAGTCTMQSFLHRFPRSDGSKSRLGGHHPLPFLQLRRNVECSLHYFYEVPFFAEYESPCCGHAQVLLSFGVRF